MPKDQDLLVSYSVGKWQCIAQCLDVCVHCLDSQVTHQNSVSQGAQLSQSVRGGGGGV